MDVVDTILNLTKEVSYDLARDVSKRLNASFLGGKYDEVRIIYNEFKSAISQNVVCETLLPIDTSRTSFSDSAFYSKEMIFEPSPQDMNRRSDRKTLFCPSLSMHV